MQPDLTVGPASFFCGDAAGTLSSLPAGVVDLTVTSPPYLLDKDYGEGQNDAYAYTAYLRGAEAWLAALYDATSDGGRLCLNVPLDTRKSGVTLQVYADYCAALQRTGWSIQTSIVWDEGTISRRTAWGSYARPSAPYVTSAVEMIVVAHKGEWKRSPNGRTWDIEPAEFKEWTLTPWRFGNATGGNSHPAPFTEELPRRLIKLYSYREDLVCDPFVGSGTTSLAATRLGRRSIGIDLERRWLELAAERVSGLAAAA